MMILDRNGFKAEISVVRDGQDETLSFLSDQVLSSENGCLVVSEGLVCITKMIAFINRQDEFEELPPRDNDFILINGKKFKCVGSFN